MERLNNIEKQELFLEHYNKLSTRLSAYAMSITRNREEAKDLVSETVLKAYENFEKLKNIKAFPAYIFKIASRIHNKRKWRLRIWKDYDEEAANQLADSSSTDKNLEMQDLYEALEELPKKHKEAIILFEISGFSVEEISEMMGAKKTTVRTWLKRARDKLRILLDIEEQNYINIRTEDRKNGKHHVTKIKE